jgi:flagellar basal-body rod protein FlgG
MPGWPCSRSTAPHDPITVDFAKTGMEGQQTKLDAISNNLANVGTNGYKRATRVFEDLMYQNLRQVGAASSEQSQLPTGLQVGLGVRAVATTRNFAQGNLQQTGNDFDVAIKGNGLLPDHLPDGTTGYTRDGSFQVDAKGQLVTNRLPLQPGITIPANAQKVTIAADGTVSVTLPARPRRSRGPDQLANFINPAGLEPRGRTCMPKARPRARRNNGAPGTNGLGSLQQGMSRAATSTWSRSWWR